MSEIQETIDHVNKLLSEKPEWKKRYEKYSRDLSTSKEKHDNARSLFSVKKPILRYSSISQAKKKNIIKYDLRFHGQSIATVDIKDNEVEFTPRHKPNTKYFNFDLQGTYLWDTQEGTEFRNYFRDYDINPKTKSPEHQMESMILDIFAEKKGSKKLLRNIQPVKIADSFFQMPTPISASKINHIEYANQGGGIDILARTKMKNNDTRLTVFELKDENNRQEPVEKVILQAISYATFICNLLEQNPTWWKIFGYTGTSQKDQDGKYTINVSTLLPLGTEQQNTYFENQVITVTDHFKIELHTLFYDQENEKFTGSLVDSLQR